MVNHKKVLELISDRKSSISDIEFFTSPLFKTHLWDITRAVTRRYSGSEIIKINIYWDENDGTVAYTDNRTITINAANPLLKGMHRQERYFAILGLLCHEIGHCFYTDFRVSADFIKQIAHGKWHPFAPDSKYDSISDEVLKYFTGKYHNIMISLTMQLSNIMEDGYIEDRMLRTFPGSLGYGLEQARNSHWNEIPPLEEMLANELSGKSVPLLTLEQLILEYVKFGELKHAPELKDHDRVKRLYSLIPLLDSMLNEDDATKRFSYVNSLTCELWEEIKEYISMLEKMAKEQGNTPDSQNSKNQSQVKGNSQQGHGNSRQICREEDTEKSSSTSTSKKRMMTRKQATESEEDKKKSSKNASESNDSSESDKGQQKKGASSSFNEDDSETDSDRSDKGSSGTDEDSSVDEGADNTDSDEQNDTDSPADNVSSDPDNCDETSDVDPSLSDEDDSEGSSNDIDAAGPDQDDSDDADSVTENDSDGSDMDAESDCDADDTEGSDVEDSGNAEDDSDDADSSNTDSTNADANDDDFGDDDSVDLPNRQNGEGEMSEVDGASDVEYNDDYSAALNDRAAEEISNLLQKMAEESVVSDLEEQRGDELTSFAQSLNYGNLHRGVPVRVYRQGSVSEYAIQQYNEIAPELLQISKQLQRSVLQKLRDYERGGKLTGLAFGRRIESRNLYRPDCKVFYKNNLPHDIPTLAIGVIIDESGSMRWNDRYVYARAAAIILYDFCQSLHIPIAIYGQSTDRNYHGQAVEIYSYAEFDSHDKNDKYRLMDIQARSNSRDSVPVRFVAERLLKRPESNKLLIVFSDGQPEAVGYSGRPAYDDLSSTAKEFMRRKIHFIAAAIGDDKPAIENIYGDAFMNISNLKELPKLLTDKIKKYLPVQ